MTKGKRNLLAGILLIAVFALWTLAVMTFDVRPLGVDGTDIGFSHVNLSFHSLTGVNMTLYNVTDWLGLVPVAVGMCFGMTGLVQLIKRRSLFRVDADILLLGAYYIIVTACYLLFEMIPINYRPVLINGFREASYPSSTTLLVLGVMPTLSFQIKRRLKNVTGQKIISAASVLFSLLMVFGRLISGVHWLTDIAGSVIISAGLYLTYKGIVLFREEKYGIR